MKTSGLSGIVAILTLGLLTACGQAQQTALGGLGNAKADGPTDSRSSQLAPRFPRYELHKSDVVELTFTFSTEFNQTVTVQPDGFLTLKDVGEFRAEGLTLPQLVDQVKTAYMRILVNPEVTATLKDFEKPSFVVGGQVAHPGKFELRADTTVTEAIAIAGGFLSSAKHSQVVLFRRVSGELYETKLINAKKIIKDKSLQEDVHLRPGDVLVVPQNSLSKIRQFVPTPGIGTTVP